MRPFRLTALFSGSSGCPNSDLFACKFGTDSPRVAGLYVGLLWCPVWQHSSRYEGLGIRCEKFGVQRPRPILRIKLGY